jgi:hypothetical protein
MVGDRATGLSIFPCPVRLTCEKGRRIFASRTRFPEDNMVKTNYCILGVWHQ